MKDGQVAADALAGGRLTIDLGALVDNWRSVARHVVAGAETAAVVKADAYGIGIPEAGRALATAGCRTFFVALPEEGLRLRAAAPGAAIYVLSGLIPGTAHQLVAADLRPVLGSWAEIEEWAAFRETGAATGAAIHVDTGMNRLGMSLHEAIELSRRDDLLRAVAPNLLMSHLVVSEERDNPQNLRQLALFREIVAEYPGVPASLANSAGVFLGPEFHFGVVRPGIALYGASPGPGVPNVSRPVVTAEARILAIREAEIGESVGYGGTQHLTRPSRLAILAAGYADGYHRRSGSTDAIRGAHVRIRGRQAPIMGRVSMDLITVDVTDISSASRGDWAELFGPNVPVDEVAHAAGTVGYELLTGLGKRYTRDYVGG